MSLGLPLGSRVILDGLLPHETEEDKSSLRRRARQFHSRSPATQVVVREESMKKFTRPEGLVIARDYSKLAASRTHCEKADPAQTRGASRRASSSPTLKFIGTSGSSEGMADSNKRV